MLKQLLGVCQNESPYYKQDTSQEIPTVSQGLNV